ncbi:unnamed protein product [Echinostoma caproni]|uniref:MFS domain-containing protein n=1 Tax=Echinostoma caproni TaxID=27848 RepID=A0A183A9A1_9TREM|nr:unnamed protein product [Echinostoma caproni]
MNRTRLDTCFRSRSRRWITIVLGIIEIFWFSGYFYGFNALIKPYQSLGVFDWFCSGTDCTKQEKMFSYAFIVASVFQLCLIPCTGLMLDRVGLRATKLFAVALMFCGGMMYAFTSRPSSVLLFFSGPLVSLGSLSSMLCNYTINAMFPRFEAIVIALISGAYDSSSAIPFIIVKAMSVMSLQTSFIILACVGLAYGIIFALIFLTQYAPEMGQVWKPKPDESDSFPKQSKEQEIESFRMISNDNKLYLDEKIGCVKCRNAMGSIEATDLLIYCSPHWGLYLIVPAVLFAA